MKRARVAAVGLGFCLLPCACKHDEPEPDPSRVAAAAASATEAARRARFGSERARARARFDEKPDLAVCTDILKEKDDVELCHAASTALTALEQLDPAAAPETTLPLLSDAAVALARLAERARYLSLEDLGHTSIEGDAGAPAHAVSSARPSATPAPKASAAPTPKASAAPAPNASAAPAGSTLAQKGPHAPREVPESPSLKLTDSPLTHLFQYTTRLERDTLRYFAAYLEYAPLPIRQLSYNTIKGMQSAHQRWPALNRMIHEASVLETDDGLKQNLTQLVRSGQPHGKRP